MKLLLRACLGVCLAAALAACPLPPRGAGGGGGGGAVGINPDACGTINTSDVGRKLYAFADHPGTWVNAAFDRYEWSKSD